MGENTKIDTREGRPDRRDNVASAGLDPSTWNELEQWREKEGITSRSDAVRRLIRDGLDAQTHDNIKQRVIMACALSVIMAIPLFVYLSTGQLPTLVLFVVTGAYVLAQPLIDSALATLKDSLPV